MRLELDTGRRTVLVNNEQLPKLSLNRQGWRDSVEVDALSDDGHTLFFSAGGHLYSIPMKGGALTDYGLTRDPAFVDPRSAYLSPDGRHQLTLTSAGSDFDQRKWTLHIQAAGTVVDLATISMLDVSLDFKWLNNEELVIASGGRVWISDLGGKTKKVLLEHPVGPPRW